VAGVIDTMGEGIGAVTPADARAWFVYCGYRVDTN